MSGTKYGIDMTQKIEAYEAIERQAREAHEATRRQAWEAYEATRRQAWEAYEAIERQAREAYEAIERQAREAYEAIERQAWEALKCADSLVDWIIDNCEDRQAEALVVLAALPATLEELDAIAKREGWCELWEDLRYTAVEDLGLS